MNLIQRFISWLARVTVVDVGKASDGLTAIGRAGNLDRDWSELSQQFSDALDAWRKNPLAKRIVGLTSAYVIGDGITLTSKYTPLRKYIETWWGDEANMLSQELGAWCDELTRSGGLFMSLHFNPANGISYVRPIPAAFIDTIETRPGDLKAELSYHETVGLNDPDYDRGGRNWFSPIHPDADANTETPRPIMLHFPINRAVGCVRGEGDLTPILPWLKRYSRWLEDRVRLNAAVRAFLWIVKTAKANIKDRTAQLMNPPEAGSVMVIDRDTETWEAVAPNLHANDAEKDGRMIRWMIASGGPGMSLTDFGEAETANLATATAMGDQRTRFLKARQAYFGYMLARLALESYNRAVRLGRVRGKPAALKDILIGYADVSSADNQLLASSANTIASAIRTLYDMGVNGTPIQRLALRLVLRFAGEQISESDLNALLQHTPAAVEPETPETN